MSTDANSSTSPGGKFVTARSSRLLPCGTDGLRALRVSLVAVSGCVGDNV